MDKKVKIILIVVPVLLVLIIVFSLYNTFNFGKSTAGDSSSSKRGLDIRRIEDNQGDLGIKSKIQIKTNSYYYSVKKKRTKRVDPAQMEILAKESSDFQFNDEKGDVLTNEMVMSDIAGSVEEQELMPEFNSEEDAQECSEDIVITDL